MNQLMIASAGFHVARNSISLTGKSFQRTCYPFILAVEVQPSSLALRAD
jgi:hypothetical protein